MRLVAPAPFGAPLAISTLGAGARSLRAPPIPSMVGRPSPGSNWPGWLTGPATGVWPDHVAPPSFDTDIISNGRCPPDELVPTPNTYALPLLSVRTVQPSIGLRCPLFAAGEIKCCAQVLPPSDETATSSGAGAALGLFSWPLNDAQQM